jgi:hypothetical protein
VRDESADTVTFSTGTSAAYSGPTRDPNHNHVGPAVTLGAADSCSTAPVVKKYAYLLDEVRPHVAESNGDGPGGSNPLRIAVAPTDDGVGLTTVQYRVVNGVTGTPLLDWTTLASPTAQLVPLYRAGVTAPSIPALGTTTGLVRFEARAVDALGRTGPVSSRCWNQTLYAAPIEMGEPAAVAATNGPAGSGKWGLGLLSLADATSPIDPVSMMLNDVAGPAGAGLYEFSVWNPDERDRVPFGRRRRPAVDGDSRSQVVELLLRGQVGLPPDHREHQLHPRRVVCLRSRRRRHHLRD